MNKTKRGPGQPEKGENKLVTTSFRIHPKKKLAFRKKVNGFIKEFQKNDTSN